MDLIDFIEEWWLSIQPLLEKEKIIGLFERSPVDRPNPSCALNLRKNDSDADLLVWESGEAELVTGERGDSTDQQHFDDLRINHNLGTALSRVVQQILER